MKKIAVISDIHSNINALTAVLADIEQENIETIVCSGDIVGYHIHINETVDLMREKEILSIMGNHDNDITAQKFNHGRELDILRYTYEALTEENREWLAGLPQQLFFEIDEVTFQVTHGSPSDFEQYLFEESDEAAFEASQCEADVLISGHTHLPWVKQYETTLFVNSGSVGKPKIGTPDATYAIIEVENKKTTAFIKQVQYDYEPVASATEEIGFVRYANALRAGRV